MSRQGLTAIIVILLIVIGFLLYRYGALRGITTVNQSATPTPYSVSVAPTALLSPTPTATLSPTSVVTVSPTAAITKSISITP